MDFEFPHTSFSLCASSQAAWNSSRKIPMRIICGKSMPGVCRMVWKLRTMSRTPIRTTRYLLPCQWVLDDHSFEIKKNPRHHLSPSWNVATTRCRPLPVTCHQLHCCQAYTVEFLNVLSQNLTGPKDCCTLTRLFLPAFQGEEQYLCRRMFLRQRSIQQLPS